MVRAVDLDMRKQAVEDFIARAAQEIDAADWVRDIEVEVKLLGGPPNSPRSGR